MTLSKGIWSNDQMPFQFQTLHAKAKEKRPAIAERLSEIP
jgi:hypothetical protein